jgi:hypothetical protein
MNDTISMLVTALFAVGMIWLLKFSRNVEVANSLPLETSAPIYFKGALKKRGLLERVPASCWIECLNECLNVATFNTPIGEQGRKQAMVTAVTMIDFYVDLLDAYINGSNAYDKYANGDMELRVLPAILIFRKHNLICNAGITPVLRKEIATSDIVTKAFAGK